MRTWHDASDAKAFRRGVDYVNFRPDRVAMQDATAQMALLQFMNAGRDRSAVPASVHCDHLIQADRGPLPMCLPPTIRTAGVRFSQSVANRYGLGFWKAGAGIHSSGRVGKLRFPGGMMIGTDSHTPNAGRLGISSYQRVGGGRCGERDSRDAVGLKMPKIIGVKSPDRAAQRLGFAERRDPETGRDTDRQRGGTNAILEYFGDRGGFAVCDRQGDDLQIWAPGGGHHFAVRL